MGFTYKDAAYYYNKNAQGDVTGIVDSNLSTVVEYSYDAWGKLLTTTGSKADTIGKLNPFLYRGYYYDAETGLYYLNSRYYDVQTGRFLNADNTDILLEDQENLTEHNLFTYCLNNPVNMADDDGGIAWWIAAAVGGAAFDTAAYIIGATVSGQKVTWAGVGKAALAGAVTGVTFGAIGKIAKSLKILTATVKTTRLAKIGTSFGKLGKLTKYQRIKIDWNAITRHGLERMNERGMSKSLIESVVRNGKVLDQGGRFLYISKKGAVVLDKQGHLVTAYSEKYFDNSMKGVIKNLFG